MPQRVNATALSAAAHAGCSGPFLPTPLGYRAKFLNLDGTNAPESAKKMAMKMNKFRIVGFDCENGAQGLCQAGRIREHPRLAPL
ncbi:MAG: hypothetical protein ACK4NM_16730 [Hydrogenophaga sp.]